MFFTNVKPELYKNFIAVYEAQNLTRAAERLFLGATGVSRNIKELEKQLDVKLFNSHSKGMKPTEAADILYKYIKAAFVEINNGENMLKAFNAVKTGHIRIGCHSYIANHILLDYICEFKKSHPKVQIKIIGHTSKSIMADMLERHDIEFIIDAVADTKATEKLATRSLVQLENTFYTSRNFFTANNLTATLSKETLSRQPLILYDRTHHTMQTLNKKIDIIEPNVHEVTTSELMYGMVAKKDAGVGYALTKFLDSISNGDEVVRLKIKGVELPKSNIAVITNRRDKNPIVNNFIDGLIKYCNENLATNAARVFKEGVDKLAVPEGDTKKATS